MNTLFSFVLVLCALASVSAFSPRVQRASGMSVVSSKGFFPFPSSSLAMSDEQQEEEPFVPPEPTFFEGNRRVRLGRSKDQDGKSNIWRFVTHTHTHSLTHTHTHSTAYPTPLQTPTTPSQTVLPQYNLVVLSLRWRSWTGRIAGRPRMS